MRVVPSPAALALFLVLFAAQMGVVALTPIVPDVAAAFGISTAAVGNLRVASAFAGGVVALGMARLLAAVRPAALLAAGVLLVAFGSVVSALAPRFVVVAVGQAMVGAGVAVCITGSLPAAGEWARPERRHAVLAWAFAGPPTAWIVGMPAIGAMASLGWRPAWALLPALAVLAALAALRRVARPPVPAPATTATSGPGPRASGIWNHDVVAYAAAETLAYAAWGGILVYAGALLRESYDVSLGAAGLLLGAAAVASLPGTAVASRYAAGSARRLVLASTIAAAVLVASFGIARPGAALSTALFGTLAFVVAARMFASGAQTMDAMPEQRSAMASARGAATQFGYLLGAATGTIMLPLGGYEALGAALAALFLLAVVAQQLGRSRAGATGGATRRRGSSEVLVRRAGVRHDRRLRVADPASAAHGDRDPRSPARAFTAKRIRVSLPRRRSSPAPAGTSDRAPHGSARSPARPERT